MNCPKCNKPLSSGEMIKVHTYSAVFDIFADPSTFITSEGTKFKYLTFRGETVLCFRCLKIKEHFGEIGLLR